MLITVGAIAIIVSFMGWDMYENKKKETAALAKAEKIYPTSDILKDADFSIEDTAISIRPIPHKPKTIVVKNEEHRKQIIKELTDLKLQESENFYPFEQGDTVQLTLNKEYSMFVFAKEKNIFFQTGEHSVSYDIVDGESFFKALNKVSQSSRVNEPEI